MKYLGIDENGYGPKIGPLVITGCATEKLFYVPCAIDSKKIFKRNLKGYETLEEIALKVILASDYKEGFLDEFSPPYWIKKFPEPFEFPFKIKTFIIDVKNFNEEIKFKKKSELNFSYFLKIIDELKNDRMEVFCGKIGGAKRIYREWFEKFFDDIEVLKEKEEESVYKVKKDGISFKISFLLNAEDRFFLCALSSIVGKYLREIKMLEISKKLGFESKIPYFSGYSDKKTEDIIRRFKNIEIRIK
ncbi:MAG: hypothetical protein DRI36_03850 [Caldiserica bacterium]|nr:MAG: hypothetical protein DRI36_03850 [Caldisericota bacterium]